MPEHAVPIAVVGGGSIGMRHIQCATASPAVELVAVVEADPARRDELAALGLPMLAAIDEVPATARAAIIAAPTPVHAPLAHACLDRGLALLVEKPLTETVADGRALCLRADRLGLPLVAGHHRRCHPFVAEARQRLADLGRLVAVQGIWALRKDDAYYRPEWRRRAGAGPVMTNLSHEIDLLRYLAGEIVEVAALTGTAARRLEIEDTLALSLRFAGGALGSIVMSDAGASPWAFEAATGENPAIAVRGPDPLRFVATAGSLEFPSLDTWTGPADAPCDWRHEMTISRGPRLDRVDGIAAQLDRFARVADGGTDDLLATGWDGLQTTLVLNAVLRSAGTGAVQTPETDG